ncbi:phycobiliprotein lyase [Roseofilum reptotaenium CS-1145]|uniref:Chromophore lyase CpcS/CpeS n=1 Tax=Roseofilum reptotaenium AO1-A TaxID=1925591 RepID=A0A1L9QS65_9CYAN|nr:MULTISPECIES: phycobiliprotein lyase [Roseofilum]MBP0030660.1 phycobiliprotein lyase [Roseofilum sp. Guam]MDB9518320.1 phycobiliprotein lyase [Roseofilum reptotaenium CS-1145]OJJ25482.1 phycobiliprotein lyase [Roseofilum reptotaenium AO1-A]
MDLKQFVKQSIGRWRSQRSAHHLAFAHFEKVRSTIDIMALDPQDPGVLEVCELYKIDPASMESPFRMTWEGESDWDEDDWDKEEEEEEEQELKGSCILVPIPDPESPQNGQLLRDRGYAETIPAIGHYSLNTEGIFTLITEYDRAAAEERIWFATPNLRFRVSQIKTRDGQGVTTASFSSEIRSLSS